MKRILLLMMCAVLAIAASAQTAYKAPVKLKTTDLGNQQLYYEPNTDSYYIMLKTGHNADPYVRVNLSSYNDAVKMLTYLLEAELNDGDYIDLENASGNTAKWNGSQYRMSEKLNPWTGNLRKQNIKGFLKAMKKNNEKVHGN